MSRAIALVVALLLVSGSAPLHGYLKLGTSVGSNATALRWPGGSATYFISTQDLPVPIGDFQAAVARGFAPWNDLANADIAIQFGGFVSSIPFEEDDVNTIGFLSRPELDRVLASTGFTYDTRNGEILESDIFFNGTFDWSVSQSAQSGRFDLQSIALHEAGHFLGLGHSAIGETERTASGGRRLLAAGAIMFPIAFAPGNIEGRTLRPDDIAGGADIYGTSNFKSSTGSLQGRITKSGRGVFGAHVVALNLETEQLVGNFTLEDDGRYVIAGLAPGLYVVRVEPLDDGELSSFFDGVEPEDLDFTPRFHERVVAVPEGGTAGNVDIVVAAR